MHFETFTKIAKLLFELVIFPAIFIIAGLLIVNFVCKNAKIISKADQTIVKI